MTYYKPVIDPDQALDSQLLPPGLVIPDDTTSLDLSNLNLGKLPIETLETIVESLPDTIVSINLSNIFNKNIEGNNLVRLLMTLAKKNIISVNLSHNNLHRLAPHVLKQAFAEIKGNIKELDISNNFQGCICQYRLEAVMEILAEAEHLQYLNVSGNIDVSISELPLLHKLLEQLPENITCLALNDSCLGALEQNELNELFEKIPPTVTTLHLGGEAYGFLSDEKYFKRLISALRHVKETTNIWQIRFPAHVEINIPLNLLIEMQSLLAENRSKVNNSPPGLTQLTQLSSCTFFGTASKDRRLALWYDLAETNAIYTNHARDLDIEMQDELLGIRIFPIATDLTSLCREKILLLTLKYKFLLLLRISDNTLHSVLEKDAKKNPEAGAAELLEEYERRQAKQKVFEDSYFLPIATTGN